MITHRHAVALAAAALLSACGSPGQPAAYAPQTAANSRPARALRAASPKQIQNVIVIVQGTRSFENLFSGFPNADAPTMGLMKTASGHEYVPLRFQKLQDDSDCGVADGSPQAFSTAYDEGHMDGWNLLDKKDPSCPYVRVDRKQIAPYWSLAKRYVLGDHFFSSTHFDSFVEQIYAIAATTQIGPKTWDIGLPSSTPGNCEAPPGTVTAELKNDRILYDAGPFPCFTQFPTMANLLDRAHVSWRYYSQPPTGGYWTAFSTIKHVREGRDWKRNMSWPASNLLSDLANGKLASVSWVISPPADSDGVQARGGPGWVNGIVAAARKSEYWSHVAIVVVWSGTGNSHYDNVPPPMLDEMGLGFRVPLIVVSPYAKHAYVSHTEYELGSILKFIEENWNLGSLHATDERANSIGDVFDF